MRYEEEQLALVAVESVRDIDRTAHVVTRIHETVDLSGNPGPVIDERVCVPSFVSFEIISAVVEALRTLTRGDLNLLAGLAAELSALACRGHFDFRDGIHADPVSEAERGIDSRIGQRLTVQRVVVLVRPLFIDSRIAGRIRGGSGYSSEQAREISAVDGDVQDLRTGN